MKDTLAAGFAFESYLRSSNVVALAALILFRLFFGA